MQDLQPTVVGNYPFVSVIIPTYRDWCHLKKCLLRLSNQTYPRDAFEVIVINNDPEDEYVLQIDNLSLIQVLQPKPGSYAARNMGIKKAKGDIIAFTDSDCLPANDWVEKGVERLLSGVDRIAGKVELYYKGGKLSLAEVYEKAFAFDQEQNAKNGVSVTANMFTSRRVFDVVGLFDETLMSGGDFEWGWRATQAGKTILYADDVNVRHPARYRLIELRNKVRRTSRAGIAPYTKDKWLKKQWGRVRGAFPPVVAYQKLIKRKDLTTGEKLKAGSLLYYLKLYAFFQRILASVRLVKKVRT